MDITHCNAGKKLLDNERMREQRGLTGKFYESEIHLFRIPVTTLNVPRRGDADFHRSIEIEEVI